MINSICIKHFQSHQDSELKLHPGVNAIVGPSDSGKTAIIRALRWVTWNRPSGDAFRSSWGGDTTVDVTMPEGAVQRVRTNKDNMYVLDGHLELKATGTTVPEEVQNLLQLDTINLQQQLDRPFLLDDSPGAVAAHFNRIAHLDRIDEATAIVQKWVRDIEQDIKAETKNVEALQADLEHFAYLGEMENAVEALEQDERAVRGWQGQINALTRHLSEISQIDQALDEYLPMIGMGNSVDSILTLYEERKAHQEKIERLDNLLEAIEDSSEQITQHQKILSTEKPIDALLKVIDQRREESFQCKRLQRCLGTLKRVNEEIKETQMLFKNLEEKFKKEMPAVCPLCGQEVCHADR